MPIYPSTSLVHLSVRIIQRIESHVICRKTFPGLRAAVILNKINPVVAFWQRIMLEPVLFCNDRFVLKPKLHNFQFKSEIVKDNKFLYHGMDFP
jgi:hypothetical protein